MNEWTILVEVEFALRGDLAFVVLRDGQQRLGVAFCNGAFRLCASLFRS